MADEELEQDDELDLDATEPEAPADESTVDEPEQDQPETTSEATPQASDEPDRQVAAPEPRQPSRAENRIRTLTDQIRERDTRLAETNRRIDELIARQSQPQPTPRESPEQRAARFALMTPQEQIAETLRESESRWEQRMQGFQIQSAEREDRTAFQLECAADPWIAKWAPQVEGKLAELRAKGMNAERMVVFDHMMGQKMRMARKAKSADKPVKQAQQRVARAQVRPANPSSDTAATRRQNQSLERRLENVQI